MSGCDKTLYQGTAGAVSPGTEERLQEEPEELVNILSELGEDFNRTY